MENDSDGGDNEGKLAAACRRKLSTCLERVGTLRRPSRTWCQLAGPPSRLRQTLEVPGEPGSPATAEGFVQPGELLRLKAEGSDGALKTTTTAGQVRAQDESEGRLAESARQIEIDLQLPAEWDAGHGNTTRRWRQGLTKAVVGLSSEAFSLAA
jgi:hypothetical protein